MSCSLDCLKGGYIAEHYMGLLKGTLDNGAYDEALGLIHIKM